MELIEYEQVIPEKNCFCKIYHSKLIEQEKDLDITSGPIPHWHSSYEFNVCINGILENHIENGVLRISSEEFALINPNVVHTSYEVTEDFIGFAVLVPEELIRMYWDDSRQNGPLTFSDEEVAPHRDKIWRYLYHLYNYSLSEAPNRILGMNACVLAIFSLLLSNKQRVNEKHTQSSRKNSAHVSSPYTDYVNAHYRENLQLEDAASHFGFNSAYFSRLFYKESGRNFKSYLSTLRLDHATYLLDNSSLTITAIAEESGFPNARSFTDLFVKVNGMTPKEYLNQKNAQNQKNPAGHRTSPDMYDIYGS